MNFENEQEGQEIVKDAGQLREELSVEAIAGWGDGKYSCWAEMYQELKPKVLYLAEVAQIDPLYVLACLIDDVEAGIEN